MRTSIRRLLFTFAASFLAIALAILGALILRLPGAAAGAYLGGLLVGRSRATPPLLTAFAWATYVVSGGFVGLLALHRLNEVASFGATALLFIPGGIAGGLLAGVVEGQTTRDRLWVSVLTMGLAHGLGTAAAAVAFRLGEALLGVFLAAAIYSLVTTAARARER